MKKYLPMVTKSFSPKILCECRRKVLKYRSMPKSELKISWPIIILLSFIMLINGK